MEKILLITGASSDLGQAYIKRYAGRYDKIVGTYCAHQDSLKSLQEEIGEKLEIVRLDMLNETEVDSFCTYLKEHGLLPGYVLHLPAQKSKMVRANELSSAQLRSDLDVTTVSFLRMLSPILTDMAQKQFGRICCMLSSVTENATAFQTSYIVSKYALLGAVKALAVEYAGKRITVNAISPSMIETKFIAETPEYVKKKKITMMPLKRLATPEDVIRAAAFVLEDANEYMTGENMLIAGGGIIS